MFSDRDRSRIQDAFLIKQVQAYNFYIGNFNHPCVKSVSTKKKLLKSLNSLQLMSFTFAEKMLSKLVPSCSKDG